MITSDPGPTGQVITDPDPTSQAISDTDFDRKKVSNPGTSGSATLQPVNIQGSGEGEARNDLIFDELLFLPLHHPLEMVELLLVVDQHLVALQEEQVLRRYGYVGTHTQLALIKHNPQPTEYPTIN